MNSVILTGRLTRDAELRQVNNGNDVVKFTLAVDRYNSSTKQHDADFINCVAFKSTGNYINNYTKKGDMVAVTGNIKTGSYTNKNGDKVYTTDVIVNTVEKLSSKKSNTDTLMPVGYDEINDTDMPY